MDVYYSDRYTIPLPERSRFPIEKYRMPRDALVEGGILAESEIRESPLASDELLRLAHTEEYVRGMRDGSVAIETLKRIGFLWSEELYLRSCATVGGALASAESALRDGIAGNLAGGTHHAHADRGEGYCVFNDIAVCTRYLMSKGLARRVAIVDLDVHQGNGNSSILVDDPGVFVFSIHGANNYPFKKVAGHLDIALPDGADDASYLAELDRGLSEVGAFRPDFIFYQMGVDPLKEDTLGKMDLSHEGLMIRDERVLRFARDRGIPVSLALGGGYAKPIELSVRAYANTYRVVKRVYGDPPQNPRGGSRTVSPRNPDRGA